MNSKEAENISTTAVRKANAILIVPHILQFKELFAIDLSKKFKMPDKWFKKGEDFYNEFLDYRTVKKPGEEYKLVVKWAKELGMARYFKMVNESLLEKDNDVFEESHRANETNKFEEQQKRIGFNNAVVSYMVEALNYLNNKSSGDVQNIALEIATVGMTGIDPSNANKTYSLNSIPDKKFTGYELLSYFYVSWMMFKPEMVPELQLPFDKEYKEALSLS